MASPTQYVIPLAAMVTPNIVEGLKELSSDMVSAVFVAHDGDDGYPIN